MLGMLMDGVQHKSPTNTVAANTTRMSLRKMGGQHHWSPPPRQGRPPLCHRIFHKVDRSRARGEGHGSDNTKNYVEDNHLLVGLPREIVTDNETQFDSAKFRGFY